MAHQASNTNKQIHPFATQSDSGMTRVYSIIVSTRSSYFDEQISLLEMEYLFKEMSKEGEKEIKSKTDSSHN